MGSWSLILAWPNILSFNYVAISLQTTLQQKGVWSVRGHMLRWMIPTPTVNIYASKILTCPSPGLSNINGMLNLVATTNGHLSTVLASPMNVALPFSGLVMKPWFGWPLFSVPYTNTKWLMLNSRVTILLLGKKKTKTKTKQSEFI